MKNYLPIVLVLVASSASAQESAVLFGRVAGKDHASSVPAAWSATMTMVRKSDNKPVESSGCVGKPSDGDLFACLAPTNTDVRIIAQAVGYESRTADIPARKDLARVRPDLELERITP